MDLWRTLLLSKRLVSHMGSRHFDLCAPGSIVLSGGESQTKLTGT